MPRFLSRRMVVAAAGVAAAGVASGRWAAATPLVTYDLRFNDSLASDVHSTHPITGHNYNVELWLRVHGDDADHTNEALANSYVVILSRQEDGGAIVAGGLTSGQTALSFNETGSRSGGGGDLNGDGISDWGSTSTAVANTNYMFCRNATAGGALGGGSVGQAVDAQTWEFRIATFQLNIVAVGNEPGRTYLEVVKPNWRNGVGPTTYAAAYTDGVHFNVENSNQQGAFAGSQGIELHLPEPAATPLLGAAAIALVRRRSNKRT